MPLNNELYEDAEIEIDQWSADDTQRSFETEIDPF